MDTGKSSKLFNIFMRIFIILVVILLIMPFIVDQAMHLFNDNMRPGDNSVIVFKDLLKRYEIVYRIIEILKKIINFM